MKSKRDKEIGGFHRRYCHVMQPKRFSTNELFLLPNNFIDFADLSGSMGLGPCREKGSTTDLCGCSLKLFPTEMEEPTMSVATLIDVKGGPKAFWLNTFKTYSFALGPFFERFFILGGPRGFRQKNLQNLDSRDRMAVQNKNDCIAASYILVPSLLLHKTVI